VAGQAGAKGDRGDTGPAGTTSWNGITDKPSAFAPSAHTHAIAEVTGLQASLDGKQPAGSYVLTTDSRLTDAREWSASTVTQTDAEAGTATTRVAWTVQRVWQAVAAWWAASAAAAKLAGIATGATANQTDAYLLSRANHTGTQPATTITGLSTVSTSGAYADLSGTPTIPAAYTLQAATTSTLGGVVISTGLSVTAGTVTVSFGTAAGTACQGNDARLSDARTPTAHNQAWSTITATPTTLAGYGIADAAASSHTHGNLTNAGAIGSTADRIAVTTTSGVLTTAAIGSGLTLSGGTLSASGGGGSLPDPYECGTFPLVSISAQPQAASVTAGGSATFSVTATATLPTATIAYQWQVSTDAGSTWSAVSGATSSSLTLSSLTTGSNGYRYRCRLTANLSQIFSSSATLTVVSGTPFSATPAGWTGSGTSASPVVPSTNTSQQRTLTAGASGTLRITGTVAVDSDDVPGVIQVAGVTVRTFTSAGTAYPQSVNISQAITAGQVVTLTAWPGGISSGGYSGWGTNLQFWIA